MSGGLSDVAGDGGLGIVGPGRVCSSARPGPLYARRSLVVGLTGGIATGKSTVAGMFAELGARVVSADAIVHSLLGPGGALCAEIAAEFGEEMLAGDGSIDRRRLGALVFSDAGKRARLEAIVHPPVLRALSDEASDFRTKGQGILVLEIPLLYETHSESMVDTVVVVSAEPEEQIDRLRTRCGLEPSEAARRVASQWPLAEKVRLADWVIETHGGLQATRRRVDAVWSELQKSLAQPQ